MNVVNPFRRLEYYKSIDDMPIYNWMKIQETNDISFMLLNHRKVSSKEILELEKGLQSLTDQYIDTFGISSQYKKILQLRNGIRYLEIEFFKTKDRGNLTLIEIKKAEMKLLAKKGAGADKARVHIHVAKYMGGGFNMKTCSVKMFYEILSEMKDEFAQKKKAK